MLDESLWRVWMFEATWDEYRRKIWGQRRRLVWRADVAEHIGQTDLLCWLHGRKHVEKLRVNHRVKSLRILRVSGTESTMFGFSSSRGFDAQIGPALSALTWELWPSAVETLAGPWQEKSCTTVDNNLWQCTERHDVPSFTLDGACGRWISNLSCFGSCWL